MSTTVVPPLVAIHQAAYERRHKILEARQQGATYRELGAQFGVSLERVRQLVISAQRDGDKPSPIERHLAKKGAA